LKKSILSLRPNQTLQVPPGNYTAEDCGIDFDVDHVHIQASQQNTVIDCGGIERHFTIRGLNVTIEGLQLENGAQEDGGCLLIHGNQTVIRRSILTNCSASGHGGAISITNISAIVTLEDVEISRSKATFGGGVWSRGNLNLINCSLFFNNAKMHGGAVFLQGPDAFLSARQTAIGFNTAVGGYGGGIAMMVRNEAITFCPDQTGIVPYTGGASLSGCSVYNNWALEYGGAIFSQDGLTLFLDGRDRAVQIRSNSAARGGAVYILFSQSFVISGSVNISENFATDWIGDGGALFMRCACIVSINGGDVYFENNAASAAMAGYGGAIFVSDFSTLNITGNVFFIANQALSGYGGAMLLQKDTLGLLSGNIAFIRNRAVGGGAVSQLWSGHSYLSGSVRFAENVGFNGGALNLESESWARISGRVSFSDNYCVRVSPDISPIAGVSVDWPTTGGAVYFGGTLMEVFGSASFDNNTAEEGGAIFASVGSLSIGDSVSVRGGTATSGGGIYIKSSTVWLGGKLIIEGNVAASGGGLFIRSVRAPASLLWGNDLS
jgi:fibronectin-binding autotransporter adhesin